MEKPYKIEYEKTFYPWIIIAKKKYTGYKYTENINKCYLNGDMNQKFDFDEKMLNEFKKKFVPNI